MLPGRSFKGEETTLDAMRRPAFTLIELLVVISIITVLIAILLPALGSARVASQRTVSVSNVRQISLAQFMYANDFKSSMPFLKQKMLKADGTVDTNDRWRPQWSSLLVDMNYLSSAAVYWSPGRAKSLATGIEDDRLSQFGQLRPTAYSYESVGYAMNAAVAGGTENDIITGAAPLPVRLGDPQAPPPSNMLLLVESWHVGGLTLNTPQGSLSGFYQISPNRYNLGADIRLFNYQGGIVRSYVDGRAHAMASNSKGLALVSGRAVHVGNSSYVQSSGDESAGMLIVRQEIPPSSTALTLAIGAYSIWTTNITKPHGTEDGKIIGTADCVNLGQLLVLPTSQLLLCVFLQPDS